MSDSIAIGWVGPTNDYWDWTLSHFRNVSLLTDRTVEPWLASQSQACSAGDTEVAAALLVAIESRFCSRMDLVRRLEHNVAPNSSDSRGSVPFGVLLGDEWVGHRRTFPLPETLNTFYWYELYDRLFPWLLNVSQVGQTDLGCEASGIGTKRRISPRVQKWIDTSLAIEHRLHKKSDKETANAIQLAMVVTETAGSRQLWCDAFAKQKVQCLATTPDQLEVWANPDLIVVDLESAPLSVQESHDWTGNGRPHERLVRRLASQFPDAIVLVAEPFPRWETWNAMRACGADLIVAKPFHLTGIFDTLASVPISY